MQLSRKKWSNRSTNEVENVVLVPCKYRSEDYTTNNHSSIEMPQTALAIIPQTMKPPNTHAPH